MANKPPAITAEEFATWLSPQGALELLYPAIDRRAAILAILRRLQHGLIRAVVETASSRGKSEALHHLSPKEWEYAEEGILISALWNTGDMTLGIPMDTAMGYSRVPVSYFNVRFEPAGVRALLPPRSNPAAPKPTPAHTPAATAPAAPDRRGRPRKDWWDDLWVEMTRQLYVGTLKFDKQADIEKAMFDWLSKQGHEAGEATIRRAARKLFRVLSTEDQK